MCSSSRSRRHDEPVEGERISVGVEAESAKYIAPMCRRAIGTLLREWVVENSETENHRHDQARSHELELHVGPEARIVVVRRCDRDVNRPGRCL